MMREEVWRLVFTLCEYDERRSWWSVTLGRGVHHVAQSQQMWLMIELLTNQPSESHSFSVSCQWTDIAQQYTTLNYATQHYTTLHYPTPHCTTLHSKRHHLHSLPPSLTHSPFCSVRSVLFQWVSRTEIHRRRGTRSELWGSGVLLVTRKACSCQHPLQSLEGWVSRLLHGIISCCYTV